jgi:predicted HTH transcriptional regulator
LADQIASLAGRLTDRDRSILRLVHEHRVFTTHQLAEVFFGSLDRAEHRLRQLTDAHVLARFRLHTRHGEGSAPYTPTCSVPPALACWPPTGHRRAPARVPA